MRKKLSLQGLLVVGLLLAVGLFPILSRSPIRKAETVVKPSYQKERFFQDIAPYAKEMSQAYGVPASLLMAQAALASNYGTSLLTNNYDNLYALPAQLGQESVELRTTTYVSGKLTTLNQRFAVYPSWRKAMYDYLTRLKAGEEWGKELYQILATSASYKVCAKALSKAKFSTDPDYAQQLISLIEERNLTQYDK